MAKVICHSCRGIYYNTTESYDPDVPPTGDMFKPKKIIQDRHWFTFKPVKTTKAGDIECPACGSLYYKNGKIITDPPVLRKKIKIPESFNKDILRLRKEGLSPTAIGNKLGFTSQAIGRRIYDVRKRK